MLSLSLSLSLSFSPKRSWLFSLLDLATKKQLDDDDVWALPEREQAETLERRYDALIQARGKLPLTAVLRAMFWRRWVLAGLFYIGWCFCAGVQPWLVAAIIGHLKDANAEDTEGYLLGFVLFGSTLGYNMFINHKFNQLTRNGIAIRNLLGSLIYRKTLRVRAASPPTPSLTWPAMATIARVCPNRLLVQ